jgi:TM2 domain-containing membrane protein YozV
MKISYYTTNFIFLFFLSMKNRGVAIVLAIFLWGLGIHKFYLGKIGQGFLYLIFCWTFIPAFIAFIEWIIYATTSDADWQVQYAGGIHGPRATADDILIEKMEKLNKLRDLGTLTPEEYEARKVTVLSENQNLKSLKPWMSTGKIIAIIIAIFILFSALWFIRDVMRSEVSKNPVNVEWGK